MVLIPLRVRHPYEHIGKIGRRLRADPAYYTQNLFRVHSFIISYGCGSCKDGKTNYANCGKRDLQHLKR